MVHVSNATRVPFQVLATDILKIDRLQANSELFFFQMRMKMDVNIVRPAEIVVHTAYKKSE